MSERQQIASVIAPQWYVTAFNQYYPLVYAHRSVEAAEPESKFACEILSLGPESRVLDLCCGNGRHLVHLQKRTPYVLGLDYSFELLKIASVENGVSGKLVRADMRRLPFCNAFDAVTSFFTSFGYFHRPEEDCAVLVSVARSLRASGRFFLDYLNAAEVRRNLIPRTEREAGGFRILEERWIDETNRRVNKRTQVFSGAAASAEFTESVRLYTPQELECMLRAAGMKVEACYGGYDGRLYTPASERTVLLARKA